MRRASSVLLAVVLSAFGACKVPAPQQAGPDPKAPAAAETPAAPAPPPPRQRVDCGIHPDDWCPAPAGDPCGAHKDVAACRADPRCGGRPYAGESLVACRFDARGFGQNCPTVGCVSLAR